MYIKKYHNGRLGGWSRVYVDSCSCAHAFQKCAFREHETTTLYENQCFAYTHTNGLMLVSDKILNICLQNYDRFETSGLPPAAPREGPMCPRRSEMASDAQTY